MRFKKIFNGLYCVKFKDAYSCLSTMIRMQEYYEATSKKIRSKYFTFQELMDQYAEIHGNFTYFTDWGGFNIDGDAVKSFFITFENNNDITEKEANFYNFLSGNIPEWHTNEKFYIIAVYDDWYLDHEIAHGLFYLNSRYEKEMRKLIREIPKKYKDRVRNKLYKWGYARKYITDEMQAYLSTSSYKEVRREFGIEDPATVCPDFRKTFKHYLKEEKNGD